MKNTPPVTSLKWTHRSLCLLLLVGLSCSLLPWGSSDVEKPQADPTSGIAKTAIETAPVLIQSVGVLIGQIVMGLILLAIMFKRSRTAIGTMLKALADAMTYRINQWKIKKVVPEDPDGPE